MPAANFWPALACKSFYIYENTLVMVLNWFALRSHTYSAFYCAIKRVAVWSVRVRILWKRVAAFSLSHKICFHSPPGASVITMFMQIVPSTKSALFAAVMVTAGAARSLLPASQNGAPLDGCMKKLFFLRARLSFSLSLTPFCLKWREKGVWQMPRGEISPRRQNLSSAAWKMSQFRVVKFQRKARARLLIGRHSSFGCRSNLIWPFDGCLMCTSPASTKWCDARVSAGEGAIKLSLVSAGKHCKFNMMHDHSFACECQLRIGKFNATGFVCLQSICDKDMTLSNPSQCCLWDERL